MSSDFLIRLIGMIAFSIFGVYWGSSLGQLASANSTVRYSVEQYSFTFGLVGALIGLILTPYVTTRPIRAVKSILGRISPQQLFASLVGLVAGLVIAALLAFPVSLLPNPFGEVLPFFGVLVFSYLGVAVFVMRQNDLYSMLRGIFPRGNSENPASDSNGAGWAESRTILLDTSVIIDGRIADIARTGFLPGSRFFPRFVFY
jgi:uncharacterized protein YacL